MIFSPSILDNPVWNALTTHQLDLALGGELARRFPPEINPLAGVAQQTPEAYAELASVVESEEQVALFLKEPYVPTEGWALELDGPLVQMVLEEPLPISANNETDILKLSDADVPEMLELTQLTKPGPFRNRTIEMGRYLGIRQSGRLAAMAGERLHMDGYTEISAVCTHPDFQGRGYARALLVAVAQNILNRGETPMLHAWADNHNAIRQYEKLGFRHRPQLQVAVIRKLPA